MTTVTLMVVAAALGYALALGLRLPPFPFLILGGFLLSRTGFLADAELAREATVMGLTFVVFTAGIELSTPGVGRQKGAALVVGLLQFGVLGAGGYWLALTLDLPPREAVYVSVAVAASSTLVVVRLLQQRGQMFEPFGRLVLGVLLLQDLLVFLCIGALEGRAEGAVGVAALIGLAWLWLRAIGPRLILRYQFDEESLLLVTLSVLFLFVGAAHSLNVAPVIGAFLGGWALSDFPISGVVRGQLRSVSDFFTALFFTGLGALTEAPGWADLWLALPLVLLLWVLTPLVVVLVAERTGLVARSAVTAGLLLAQTSEFSLVVGLHGLAEGHLRSSTFSMLVLVTVLTMALTPAVSHRSMVWWLMRLHPARRRVSAGSNPAGHVLLLGWGDTGREVSRLLQARKIPAVVVEDDPVQFGSLLEEGVTAVYGDGSDRAVLHRAGVGQARLILSLMRSVEDHLTALKLAGDVPMVARVFSPAEAARLEARGAVAVVYSTAAAQDFLQWFDEKEVPATTGGAAGL